MKHIFFAIALCIASTAIAIETEWQPTNIEGFTDWQERISNTYDHTLQAKKRIFGNEILAFQRNEYRDRLEKRNIAVYRYIFATPEALERHRNTITAEDPNARCRESGNEITVTRTFAGNTLPRRAPTLAEMRTRFGADILDFRYTPHTVERLTAIVDCYRFASAAALSKHRSEVARGGALVLPDGNRCYAIRSPNMSVTIRLWSHYQPGEALRAYRELDALSVSFNQIKKQSPGHTADISRKLGANVLNYYLTVLEPATTYSNPQINIAEAATREDADIIEANLRDQPPTSVFRYSPTTVIIFYPRGIKKGYSDFITGCIRKILPRNEIKDIAETPQAEPQPEVDSAPVVDSGIAS